MRAACKHDPGDARGRLLLIELVERIAACQGADTYIPESELAEWPADLVQALRGMKLLAQASPATSAECPGCEEACVMPVDIVFGPESGAAQAMTWCDKRHDIGRVVVPITSLARMKSSGALLAHALATLLQIEPVRPEQVDALRWRLGQFQGTRHKGPLVLSLDLKPVLMLAGHSVALVDVLRFGKGGVTADSAELRKLVDSPTGMQAAGEEAPQERADRIRARMAALKAQGVRNYRQRVAEEEGLDPSRIGQILRDYPARKPGAAWHPEAGKAGKTPAKMRKA